MLAEIKYQSKLRRFRYVTSPVEYSSILQSRSIYQTIWVVPRKKAFRPLQLGSKGLFLYSQIFYLKEKHYDFDFTQDYRPTLTIRDTEAAIVFIRETFQDELASIMGLQRMSAPMFVEKASGLNDNLNGVERPVAFDMKAMPDNTIEVVHSLAKWKRLALKKYGFGIHEGLYTNLGTPFSRDEDLDNFHSIYVDQWDWEKVIAKEERNTDTLEVTVMKILKQLRQPKNWQRPRYPGSTVWPITYHLLPLKELEDRWPELTPEERENKIAKEEKGRLYYENR